MKKNQLTYYHSQKRLPSRAYFVNEKKEFLSIFEENRAEALLTTTAVYLRMSGQEAKGTSKEKGLI